MDIRVAAYGTTNVSTFSSTARNGAVSNATYVQSAENSAPVTPVAAVRGGRGVDVANGGQGGGYTDSVRGSIINILA